MRVFLAVATLLVATFPALAQQNVGRYGVTICITGGVADACAPIYALPTGNYTVKYTGSLQPPRNSQTQNTDDNSILDCGPNNTANVTITLPTSSSTVFPPGHGLGVKNSATNFICTVTVASAPNTSIYGAAGVVNGSPAAVGGPIAIFPGGEAYFTVDKGNKWLVTGFMPGVWYQTANNVAELDWFNLSGYAGYDLYCAGVMPVISGATLWTQVVYDGVIRAAGYNWATFGTYVTNTAVYLADSTSNATYFPLAGGVYSPSDFSLGAGVTVEAHYTFTDGLGAGYRRSIMARTSWASSSGPGTETTQETGGRAPDDTTVHAFGLRIAFDSSSNIRTGLCWLKPVL